MEIQKSNNLQFGARYINPAVIKAKIGSRWKDAEVSFIKFDTDKRADIRALEGVEALWNGKNLSGGIAEEARVLGGDTHIYGLTTQTEQFDTVNPKQILGLISTGKIKKGEDTVEIFKIGTNPEYAYAQKRRSRDIKHIAKTLIESFKSYASKKAKSRPIVSFAESEDEVKFLSKVGLEPESKDYIKIIN